MQVDIFLYQERARLRTELNQLRTIINEKKLIAVEQIAIFENEIIEKQKKIEVIDYLLTRWRERQYLDLLERR